MRRLHVGHDRPGTFVRGVFVCALHFGNVVCGTSVKCRDNILAVNELHNVDADSSDGDEHRGLAHAPLPVYQQSVVLHVCHGRTQATRRDFEPQRYLHQPPTLVLAFHWCRDSADDGRPLPPVCDSRECDVLFTGHEVHTNPIDGDRRGVEFQSRIEVCRRGTLGHDEVRGRDDDTALDLRTRRRATADIAPPGAPTELQEHLVLALLRLRRRQLMLGNDRTDVDLLTECEGIVVGGFDADVVGHIIADIWGVEGRRYVLRQHERIQCEGVRLSGLEEDACGTTLIQDDKFAIQKIIAAVRSLNGHRQVREGLLVERIESYGAAESVAGEEKLSLEVNAHCGHIRKKGNHVLKFFNKVQKL
eukprot:PhM_4_TR2815/c0_g1_i1/m.94088